MVKISSSVHTRLENGMNLRKDILEAALRTTQLAQTFRQYKQANIEKNKLLIQFKKEVADLKQTVHELEFKDLPKDVVKEPKGEEPIIESQSLKQIEEEFKQEIETPIIKSELETQIEDLKSQIDNIKI
jgi:hypothetical protein